MSESKLSRKLRRRIPRNQSRHTRALIVRENAKGHDVIIDMTKPIRHFGTFKPLRLQG